MELNPYFDQHQTEEDKIYNQYFKAAFKDVSEISKAQFCQIIKRISPQLSEDEINHQFDQTDNDRNGVISNEEVFGFIQREVQSRRDYEEQQERQQSSGGYWGYYAAIKSKLQNAKSLIQHYWATETTAQPQIVQNVINIQDMLTQSSQNQDPEVQKFRDTLVTLGEIKDKVYKDEEKKESMTIEDVQQLVQAAEHIMERDKEEKLMNRLISHFIDQLQAAQNIEDKNKALEVFTHLIMSFLNSQMHKIPLNEQDLFNIFNEFHSFLQNLAAIGKISDQESDEIEKVSSDEDDTTIIRIETQLMNMGTYSSQQFEQTEIDDQVKYLKKQLDERDKHNEILQLRLRILEAENRALKSQQNSNAPLKNNIGKSHTLVPSALNKDDFLSSLKDLGKEEQKEEKQPQLRSLLSGHFQKQLVKKHTMSQISKMCNISGVKSGLRIQSIPEVNESETIQSNRDKDEDDDQLHTDSSFEDDQQEEESKGQEEKDETSAFTEQEETKEEVQKHEQAMENYFEDDFDGESQMPQARELIAKHISLTEYGFNESKLQSSYCHNIFYYFYSQRSPNQLQQVKATLVMTTGYLYLLSVEVSKKADKEQILVKKIIEPVNVKSISHLYLTTQTAFAGAFKFVPKDKTKVTEDQKLVMYESSFNNELTLLSKIVNEKIKNVYQDQLIFNVGKNKHKSVQLSSMRLKDLMEVKDILKRYKVNNEVICGFVEEAPRNWGGSFLRSFAGYIQWLQTILVLDNGMLLTHDIKKPEDMLEKFDLKDFKFEPKVKDSFYDKNFVFKLTRIDNTYSLEFAVPNESEFNEWCSHLTRFTQAA